MQVLLHDMRSISEMRFKLPDSLGDGETFPQHLIQALGTVALMPENFLDFILLMPFDHHW